MLHDSSDRLAVYIYQTVKIKVYSRRNAGKRILDKPIRLYGELKNYPTSLDGIRNRAKRIILTQNRLESFTVRDAPRPNNENETPSELANFPP